MKWFLSLLMMVLLSCNRKKQEAIKPSVQNITESVYASGLVKSNNQYQVFTTVNAVIAETRVKEGDNVRKGDILLTLADEKQQLNAENARIAATYNSVELNRDRLKELQINIDLARTKMEHDSTVYQRQQNLWKQNIGSRNELEQRELAWKNARTSYQSALLQYNNLKRNIDFNARQSSKNVEISNSVNSDYIIRARQNGRVYSILKEPGEMVTPQVPVAVIGDVNAFMMELQVDEYDISKIKIGQRIYVNMDSYKGQTFEATATRIQPIMDERSRSFKVEAEFLSRPADLYPNLTVEANILISTKSNALTIPRNFLGNDNMVTLKNGEKKKVTTGLMDYQRVEILSGLSKEDEIIKPTP